MTAWAEGFLGELDPVRWKAPEGFPAGFEPEGLFVQPAPHGLEVVLASAAKCPTQSDMHRAWLKRRDSRACPVLVVVGYPLAGGLRLAVCGPVGDRPAVQRDFQVSSVERIARLALAEPSHHSATRFLLATLPEVAAAMPGLRNVGLLATHELREGVPKRPDWQAATAKSMALLARRGKGLVQGLGFDVEALAANASLLTLARRLGGGVARVVAVFLDDWESYDSSATRFGMSPVSYALALADQKRVPWVILTRKSEIRLYAARVDTGVGRKGRAETFVELNLALLPDERAGYLQLLFSAAALGEGGTVEDILDNSARFAASLAVRLRERVYFDVVPALAGAVAQRLGSDPTEQDLIAAYEQVMVVLFRLLFVAYAEDKDLLPYRTNGDYAEHSLSQMAKQILDAKRDDHENYRADRYDLWQGVIELWRTVYQGREPWGVPAYNGGLFSSDKAINAVGAQVSRLELSDAEFGPVLAALLIDKGPEGDGPVDFRSLSVREFGTIYEGLLESQLSVARCDLNVDKQNNYEPATESETPLVYAGEVYFHNRSGARKDTGSYFTKPFAVEHLLDHALTPALDDHIKRLESCRERGDDAAVAESFFDFRCADIAMGSGHFLVAAVDRIEARLSSWLALNPIPAVTTELNRLRTAAYDALGDLGNGVEIETGSLLRRQVARHCIYGVDLNHISIELARLSIWIHTFVPGLPLSFLDHNLVVGDSLAGVGTLDEVVKALDPTAATGTPSLFREEIEGFLRAAAASLERLARTSDASATEITEARLAHREALAAVAPAVDLFDLLTGKRAGFTSLPENLDPAVLRRERELLDEAEFAPIRPVHFPAVFPEVFLRPRPGFDCLLGNPPWEKLSVEAHGFWALRYPGLRSLPVAKMNAEMRRLENERPDLAKELASQRKTAELARNRLANSDYPDLGSGAPDLYKAFAWRFWRLGARGGTIGVVLPRAAMASTGMTRWRLELLEQATFHDVTIGTNNRGWMFDDVHPQFSICLVSILKTGSPAASLSVRGPFRSLPEYVKGLASDPIDLPVAGLKSWTTGATLPMIPSVGAKRVFLRLRESPRLDANSGFVVRPVGGDMQATSGKKHMVFDPQSTDELWPVYTGASFNLWAPDFGDPYGWAQPETVLPVLLNKRHKSAQRANSAFVGRAARDLRDPATLPLRSPRIAFRDVARATDSRTLICCLIPPDTLLVHTAPYLLWPVGTAADAAFVLGVLCTMVMDWFARCIIELHMNLYLVNSFPIPDVAPATNPRAERVAEIAGRLAAVDDRFAGWATELGVPVGSVTSDAEKNDLLAELDAIVAHLYGLKEDDLAVIYTTFHRGADYSQRHGVVLEHFRRLR